MLTALAMFSAWAIGIVLGYWVRACPQLPVPDRLEAACTAPRNNRLNELRCENANLKAAVRQANARADMEHSVAEFWHDHWKEMLDQNRRLNEEEIEIEVIPPGGAA